MEKADLKKDDIKQWYLSTFSLFEDRLNGSKNVPFHKIRKQAITKFSELGFPTQRDEEWKYTNVAPILAHKFRLDTDAGDATLPREEFDQFIIKDFKENLIVFVNGHYKKDWSTFDDSKESGLIVEDLRLALLNQSKVVDKYLGKYADFETEAFTALNTAFTNEGIVIHVADNKVLEEPIHMINICISKDVSFVSHPRNLFVMGKNSQVKIIESYHHLYEGAYFNNLVTEIVLDEGAIVDYLKVQEESSGAYHISNTQVHQRRNSTFTSVSVDLGGALVRNNLNIVLNGENCTANMFGFYLGKGQQHIDNHTYIDHAVPYCRSNELYKGILDDKAKGVFSGKILVRPDAQKTNAFQSNKTLLLTDDAAINAKPQLEIFADDVKCTHGATIGQLDEEALFYLRARGISEVMAGAMLRQAFISDVLKNIKIEPLRKHLDHKIIEHFTE